MCLTRIFSGVIRRQQELTIAVAIGPSPVDHCAAVIDNQLPVHPQLNMTGGSIRPPANLEAAPGFHPLLRNAIYASGGERGRKIGPGIKTRSPSPLARG